MQDIAVGAVNVGFGLDPFAAAALGAARYTAMYRRAGKRPYRAYNEPIGPPNKSAVPNVVAGGIGHYQGDFKKVRTSIRETPLSQYGAIRETEHFGEVNCSDVQYFNVQSVNVHIIARALAAAYIRMIFWRHFRQTYGSEGDVLFPSVSGVSGIPNLYQIRWVTGRMNSVTIAPTLVNASYGVNIGGTTVLDDVVSNLVNEFLTNENFGFIDYTGAAIDQSTLIGYQFVYKVDNGTGVVPGNYSYSHGPVYYTSDQPLSLNVTTVVQLQNVTRSNYASEGIAGHGFRDDIGANPLSGRCFTLKGLYPLVEQQYRVPDYANTLRTNTDITSYAGITIPDTVPVGAFKSIPTPQVFRNIIKCESGLRLEPGDIKKDVLKFRFRGTMKRLFDGLRMNAQAGNLEEHDYDSHSMGYCKLFAFEKVMPTGPDSVEMNYHLDRYISCVFGLSYHQHSVRREYQQTVFNRLLAPPVGGAAVAVEPLVKVEDPAINEVAEQPLIDDQ